MVWDFVYSASHLLKYELQADLPGQGAKERVQSMLQLYHCLPGEDYTIVCLLGEGCRGVMPLCRVIPL